jgi:hypothetical protein
MQSHCGTTARAVSRGTRGRGTVYIDQGGIVAVHDAAQPPPEGFEDTRAVDVRGTIFPGLIELHNHLAYNALRLWHVPRLFTNRGQWGGTPEYQRLVTGPMKVLGLTEDVMPSLVRYVECKCLVGGVTTSQGIELFSNAGARAPSGVTPDGRVLFGARDLMMVALDGTRRMQPLVETPYAERNGVVSSDGRWLAYESNSSGQFEIYVAPFPNASTRQWLTSTGGGTRPLWAPSGQELFYVAPDGAIMAVRVDSRGDTWGAGSPAKVVEGPYVTGGGTARTHDVSTDGRRFLMVKQAPAAQVAAPQIIVVQNWLEELKRLVPVN